MKTSFRKEFSLRVVGLSLVAALALGAAAMSQAQVPSANGQGAPTSAKAATMPTKAPALHAAKGQHEGIKVHGHWTIEVRNPDGKLVTHREFENSLYNQNGGAALLTAMLGRTVTTGSWEVFLFDNGGQTNAVIIPEPNSEAATACPALAANYALEGEVASCSNNLTLSGPTGSGAALSGNTLTFTGSGTVPQGFPASIGYVSTQTLACATTDSPTACFKDPAFLNNFPLTARALDGLNGDPAPVPVTAGQTVAVTVVISFQ